MASVRKILAVGAGLLGAWLAFTGVLTIVDNPHGLRLVGVVVAAIGAAALALAARLFRAR